MEGSDFQDIVFIIHFGFSLKSSDKLFHVCDCFISVCFLRDICGVIYYC